jgi:hypothetical protein
MEKISMYFKEKFTDLIIFFIVICNYFGLLFITKFPIIGLLLSIIIGVSCWYIKENLIMNKNINFKNKLVNKFTIFWAVFISIGVLNFIIISHIYNINYTYKKQIIKDVNDKLNAVQGYSNELKKRIDAYYMEQYVMEKDKCMKEGYFSLKECNEIALRITNPAKVDALEDWEKSDSIIKEKNLMYSKVFKEWHVTDLMKNYEEIIKYNKINYDIIINIKLNNLPLDNSNLHKPLQNKELSFNNPFLLYKELSGTLINFLVPLLLVILFHSILLIPYFKVHKQFYHQGEEPKGAKIL